MPRIRSQTDIETGLEALKKLDPDLTPLIETIPHVPLRLRPAGFEGLAEIIVGQLVSRASATAIFTRLKTACSPLTPEQFLAIPDEALQGVGLSRAKHKTLTHAAQAITNGALDLDAIASMPPQEAIKKLTALHGIGPWTADIYLLFCAGHADIFPRGDIALYAALGDHWGLGDKCSPKQAADHTQCWSPWRGIAARLFYARYAQMKGREIIPISSP